MNRVILYLKQLGPKRILFVSITLLIIIGASLVLMRRQFTVDPKFQTTFNDGNYSEIINTLQPKIVRGQDDIASLKLLSAAYIQKANAEPKSANRAIPLALEFLKHAESADPTDSEVHRLIGWAHMTIGDLVKAEAAYRKSINVSGNKNTEAMVGLALIYEKQGDMNVASSAFLGVLALDGKNETARLGLARYEFSVKNFDAVITEATKVLQSQNRSVSAGAYELLGSAYLVKKDFAKALESYKTATDINPNLVHAYVLQANALIQGYFGHARIQNFNKMTTDALAVLEQAHKIDPTYIYAYTTEYQVYMLRKDSVKALETGKKIVSLLHTDTLLSAKEKADFKQMYGGPLPTVKVTNVKVENKTNVPLKK